MATKIKGTGIATGAIDSTQLATLSGHLDLSDSKNIRLGNDQDLQIYHDSGNSYIKEIGPGALVLQSAGPAIVLEKTDGENMLLANTGGAVTLYYSGSAKLATSSSGVAVTGNLAVTGSNGVIDIATSGNEINFSRNAANYLNASGSSASLVFLTNNSTALTLNSGQNATFAGNVIVTGDLTVNGTNTALNVTTLDVEDKNITLNYHASNDTSSSANGAGITIQDAVSGSTDASILWDASNDEFDFSHNISLGSSTSGNLQVGSANSFQIQKSGVNAYINQSDSGPIIVRMGSGFTERMRIDSAGDVLIGTTSNNYTRGKFTVFGTPGNPATTGTNADNVAIRVATDTGNSQSLDIGMYNSGDYGAWLQASNSGSLQSQSPIALNPNGGKVGIGTALPGYPLDVQRSSGHSYIRTKSTASNTRAALLTTGEDSGGNEVNGYFGSVGDANEVEIASLSNHQLKFYVNNTPSKGMIIDTDGDIGMGVSPATHAKLTLGGTTTSYSSSLAFDNNTTGGATFFMLASDNTWSAGANKFLMGHGSPSSSAVDVAIDADGNVGINESSPLGKLHVKAQDTGATANSVGNLLVLEGTENGLSILSSTSGAGYILFGDSDDNAHGGILYDQSAGAMRFRTGSTWDQMKILANGNVGIGTSNPSNYSTETTLKINGSGWGRLDLATGDVVRTSLFAGSGYTALTAGNSRITLNQNSHISINTAGAERFKVGTSGDLQIGYGGAALQQVTTAALSVITPASSGGQNIAFKRLDSNNDQGLGALTWSNNTQDNQAKIFVKTAGATNTTDMQFHVNSAGILKEAITINGSHANGAVGIGETDPTQAKVVIKSHGATTELALLVKDANNNDTFFVQGGGRVGTHYWPLTVGIPATTAAATSAKFQVEEAGLLTVLTNGNVGIGLTSPQLPLDIMPDSSKKIFGSQQNSTQHGFCEYVISGTIGAGAVTITMQCPSYFQAEVVATFQQSNGGSDNNVYFNGIWSNNHTTHLFKNKTNGGTVPRIGSMGTNPTFSVGVGDAASNSGKLIFTKAAAANTSGTYCIRVIAYGYSSRYMTYVVS